MVRYVLTLLFAAAPLACNACNEGRAAPAPAAAPAARLSAAPPGGDAQAPGETVVRVEDDGKSIDVVRGGNVTFKLARNAATGYSWTPTKVDPAILVLQADLQAEKRGDEASDRPGGPRLDVLRFVTGDPGTTIVQMALQRSFGNAPPARTIEVTVTVH